MELPKKAAKLFADNAKLQKMAYNMMVEICKGHGGKFRFSSDLCIDLDYGVIGVTTCNLKMIIFWLKALLLTVDVAKMYMYSTSKALRFLKFYRMQPS